MREEIISILKDKSSMSMDIDSIAKKLKIKNKGILQEELNNLVSEGILDYSAKKNKYLLFENSHLTKVRIGALDKLGNVTVDVNGEKISILKKNLRGATYNDLVAIDIDGNNHGVVARVIERDANNYVGEVIVKNDKFYIKDKRLGLIDLKGNQDFVEGQKVLLRHEAGTIKIGNVIGHKNDPGIDVKSILYDHNFSDEFNEYIISELKDIPTSLSQKEINYELANNNRKDYRGKKIITLDCDDTKDIDDAISITALDNGGFELNVYIADVSHYVKEKSAIDEEAYNRATSVYPPGCVNPMLDHKISNGICSLNPNVDRLAMCYTTIFDANGKVVDFKVEEAIINSNKKMTYSAVNDILLNDEIKEDYQDYLIEIYQMQKLSLLINSNLASSGYLNFVSSESEIIIDEEGIPTNVQQRPTGPAQKMIEMFMIITNIELTKYAYYLGLPWVYRVHGEPNQDRLQTAYKILNYKKYQKTKEKKKYSSSDIQKTMNLLREQENASIFSKMFISCQDKAKYSDENIGHYAIGSIFYSHNTSPIRRYPDLINQRIIKSFLHNGLEDTINKYEELREQAIHCSTMEREAEAVEREAVDLKKAKYMEQHIGEVYTGYISYVGRFGFWVMLDNTIEGFVHLNNLPRDKYKYSDEVIALFGTNHTYSIGDKIEIKVKSADPETRTIDFLISKEYTKNEEKENTKPKKLVKTI